MPEPWSLLVLMVMLMAGCATIAPQQPTATVMLNFQPRETS